MLKIAPFYAVLLVLAASCEGPEGPEGLRSLVDIADEPPGANCPAGGVKITSGMDTNANGALDANEVTMTKFICDGSNGISTLLTTTAEPGGTTCPQGGTKVQVGQDDNNDGQLGATEVDQTRYICNGTSSLVVATDVPSGNEECAAGGTKFQTGKDLNGDGQLSGTEIQQTKFVCNGIGRKEIRFTLGSAGTSFAPGNSTVPVIQPFFDDFNIANYPGYDSIVLLTKRVVVYPNPTGSLVYDKPLIIELVNRSNNNAVIAGSTLTVVSLINDDKYVSNNISSAFPSGAFNLGISIRSSDQNYYGQAEHLTLVMFDKD